MPRPEPLTETKQRTLMRLLIRLLIVLPQYVMSINSTITRFCLDNGHNTNYFTEVSICHKKKMQILVFLPILLLLGPFTCTWVSADLSSYLIA